MSLNSAVSANPSHSWLGLTLPKFLTTPFHYLKTKLKLEISFHSGSICNIIQASVKDGQLLASLHFIATKLLP